MLPLYNDPHFTFRFADNRIIPRFHLEGVEVGRRVAGPVRVALQVDDAAATAEALVAAGATRLGGPVVTPWGDKNVRIEASGLQLTLFTAEH